MCVGRLVCVVSVLCYLDVTVGGGASAVVTRCAPPAARWRRRVSGDGLRRQHGVPLRRNHLSAVRLRQLLLRIRVPPRRRSLPREASELAAHVLMFRNAQIQINKSIAVALDAPVGVTSRAREYGVDTHGGSASAAPLTPLAAGCGVCDSTLQFPPMAPWARSEPSITSLEFPTAYLVHLLLSLFRELRGSMVDEGRPG